MALVQAVIYHGGESKLKSTRASCMPTLTLYDDTATQRTVSELRFFADCAKLETRTLYDFDGVSWQTYGEAGYQDLSVKEALQLERIWLDQVTSALTLDTRNSDYKRKMYYLTG